MHAGIVALSGQYEVHGVQVKAGDRLPTVELVMPTAADPTPDLFVTTDDLFQGEHT